MFATYHRAAAGFAAALLFALPLAAATVPAQADTSAPPATATDAPSAPAWTDCTDQGGVFVVVTSEDGTSIGGCAGQPGSDPGQVANGTAALEAIGVTITRSADDMICALNNYPDPCPTTFNGKYWQYYQASAADATAGNWAYATVGSDTNTLTAGWVEGWCYGDECLPQNPAEVVSPVNMPGTTPAPPTITFTGTPVPAQPAAEGNSHTGLIIGLCAIAVLVVAAAVVFIRRHQTKDHQA